MSISAYLRVYEPLESFPPEERGHWLAQEGSGDPPDLPESRRWLLFSVLPQRDAEGTAEGAFVRRVGDSVLVCPWRTRLRMLAGLLAFRGSVPDEVAEAFVPEQEARRAAQELAGLDDDDSSLRSHILHANWHVPLRWFAAFEDSERILTEDHDGLRIRYETTVAQARVRLERALEVLEASGIEEGVVEALRELDAWLESFSELGLLELDYGSVAAGFEPDDLVEDHCSAEVWTCIEALACGDVVQAGQIFESLSERWGRVRSREGIN